MEKRVQATEARTITGVAAIAAKAAAAAKAVQAERPVKNGTTPNVQPLSAPKVVGSQATKGEIPLASDEKVPPRTPDRIASRLQVGNLTQGNATASNRGPELFSMDADDDDSVYDTSSPSHLVTLPLEERISNTSTPDRTAPGLSAEEEREYQEIEARFERFRERQNEVEQNVTALLARLNTQIRVPSSCASSECGDLTSLASSDWDSESLGPTEDGLSMLSSRTGSPLASPREAAFPTTDSLALSETTMQLLSRAEKMATPTGRTSMGNKSSSARDKEMSSNRGGAKRPSFGGGIGERGDLSDLRSNTTEALSKTGSDSPPRQSPRKGEKQPRLTSLLLEQSGLSRHARFDPDCKKTEIAEAWTDSPMPNFGSQDCGPENSGEVKVANGDSSPRQVLGRVCSPPPQCDSSRNAVTKQTITAMASGAPPPTSITAPGNASFVQLNSTEVSPTPGMSSSSHFHTPAHSPAPVSMTSPLVPSFGGDGFQEDEDLARWCGWTVVATPEGRLFFHNEQAQLSQWSQPPELANVLGEWVEFFDETQPDAPRFWRNDFLRISLWKDPRQTTNIFQAALDGNLFFLQLYAEVDGQLDVIDPKGRGALHYSCAGGATQSALFLLQRKAQVDRRDETASTPLMFACRYGYASIVKLLLDAQAGLNVANDSGNTALHEAASMGHLDCLHLLLLWGASATMRNAEGDGAADIAAAKKHCSCLTLLRRHISNAPRVDKQDSRRPAPVGIASPAIRPSDSVLHNTILEVPSTTSESDPLVGTGSSSDPSLARTHGTTTSSIPGGYDEATALARAGAECGSHPSSGRPGVRHRRGRRAAGRPPQVEYVGHSSDSDLNEVDEALGPDGLVGYDSGGASSGESPEGDSNNRRARGPTSRSTNGRREGSPEAPGLMSRMNSVTRLFGAARRWMTGPIQADLGNENRFVFNESTKQWECLDDDEADNA